jgi:hypothetical protein
MMQGINLPTLKSDIEQIGSHAMSDDRRGVNQANLPERPQDVDWS